MTSALLARSSLPPDTIDLAIGEAHTVKKLVQQAGIDDMLLNISGQDLSFWDYPNPNGYAPLVELLQERHNAPIVITNGAKQALAATFYALHQQGKTHLGLHSPYWSLIPPLVIAHRLWWKASYLDIDAALLVAPNNPDGYISPPEVIAEFEQRCKTSNIPLIHDAAYYTHAYLPATHPLTPFGDMQIYSLSKMYGLSSLRVGYVVCRNPDYYEPVMEYVEMMTVGVSHLSQDLAFQLLDYFEANPAAERFFETGVRKSLRHAREEVATLTDVFEIPDGFVDMAGMFAFLKVKDVERLRAAKIEVLDGKSFGKEGHVRMNLAVGKDCIDEVVLRLGGK